MGEGDRVERDAGERFEGQRVERGEQGVELIAQVGGRGAADVVGAVGVAEDAGPLAADRGEPVGVEVVAVEVREADRADVADADARADEALGRGARLVRRLFQLRALERGPRVSKVVAD